MRFIAFIFCFLFLSNNSFGQSTSLMKSAFVDAQFPGGSAVLTKYIENNLVIPDDFEGKGDVSVRFTIDENGKIKDVSPRRTIEGCEACTKNALELIRQMPDWKPAFSNEKKQAIESVQVISIPFQ